jgi:iron complex transport system permease protein
MERNDRGRAALPLMLLALLAVTLAGLTLGPTQVYLPEALRDPGSAAGVILRHIRLPRVLTTPPGRGRAGDVGALLQSVLHNPLASPGIIGVNAGAGWARRFAWADSRGRGGDGERRGLSGRGEPRGDDLWLSRGRRERPGLAIVLAGVAMGTLFSAAVDALTILFPDCLAPAISSRSVRGGCQSAWPAARGGGDPRVRGGVLCDAP